TVVKVFHQLQFNESFPLTVREGKHILTRAYKNDVNKEFHDEKLWKRNKMILSMNDIWFRYEKDSPDILGGVHLEVYEGEITSILGGNGSGKTTLLNVLSGQYRPYHGNIYIDGKPLKKYKRKDLYKNLLAVLPQDPQTVFI